MVGSWLLAGLGAVVLLILAIWLTNASDISWQVIWGIWAVVMIAGLGYLGVVLAYRRLSVRYRLTSSRFFHEQGILRHVTDRIEVIDMDDISYEQSLLQRMMGVGTIRITSSDRTHPVLDIRGIENVREVSSLMDDARRDERRRRGLHIESV
jgi:membrane protein YdbS with pleckstrin-like domain